MDSTSLKERKTPDMTLHIEEYAIRKNEKRVFY
uniref:Transposase n=1 Tax=Heterorhabditis bacteriophora TaxID=37862 RepID=A0A1I7WCW6_HETBA